MCFSKKPIGLLVSYAVSVIGGDGLCGSCWECFFFFGALCMVSQKVFVRDNKRLKLFGIDELLQFGRRPKVVSFKGSSKRDDEKTRNGTEQQHNGEDQNPNDGFLHNRDLHKFVFGLWL